MERLPDGLPLNDHIEMAIDLTGRTIAGLDVFELIGLGGVAEVYRAFDARAEREVALKVLSQRAEPDMIRRFMREGRVLLGLRHPHIVEVYDVGEAQMLRYIVMELMAAGSLKECLQRGTLDWREATRIALEIARALEHAHTHGVIHRDVKPGNVMFAADGRAKLTDFGLAGVADASAMTRTGTVLGTVFYLSPEQAVGRPVDGRTDLYALGAMLYEMLVGQPPFTGPSAVSIIYKHLNEEPRPLRQLDPSLPQALEHLVSRLLSKSADGRPETAGKVAEALEDLLRSDGQAAHRAVDLVAPAEPDDDIVPYAGRSEERAALEAALERALAGEGRTLMLSGEAGMGKTRLMDEIAAIGQARNVLILRGECLYDNAPDPYAPWVAVIRTLERALASVGGERDEDEFFRQHLDLVRNVLGLEGAREHAAQMSWFEQSSLRDAQAQLFESITQLVLLNARRRPLTVMLDDLQWASETTLQLFHYLSRAIGGARVLLLGAYRLEDILADREGRAHPLREVLRRMSRERLYEEIPLAPLGDEEIEFLVSAVLDTDTTAVGLVETLGRESEGNPFYLLETLRLIRDKGDMSDHREAYEAPPDGGVPIPDSVLDVVMRRIERVGMDDRDLLDWAAVMGQRFDPAVLAPVVGQSRLVVLRRLRDIQRRHGLVRDVGDDDGDRRNDDHHHRYGMYRFEHFKIWQALYEEFPAALRREYHGVIAHAYEDLCGGDVEPFIYELARHYSRSAERTRGYRYLEMAADRAESAYALAEAISYLDQMLSMAEEINLTAEGRTMLLHRCGRLLLTVGRQDEGRDALESALELARQGDDHRRQAEIMLDLAVGHGRVAQWDEAVALGDESRAMGFRVGDSALQANALLTTGFFAFERGEWDDAVQRLNEALALVGENDLLKARILGNLGILHDARNQPRQAIELYAQCIEIARAHDQLRDLGRALNNMGYAYQRLSEHDEALECYRQALEALERAGDVREQGTAHLHLAEIGLAMGDIAMAREHCLQATRRYTRLGFELGVADVDRVYAGIAHREGRWRVAERYLRDALAVYQAHGDRLNAAETHEELGTLLAEVGEDGRAEEELRQSRTIFNVLRGKDLVDSPD